MSETIKPKSDLLADWASNGVHAISAEDGRNIIKSTVNVSPETAADNTITNTDPAVEPLTVKAAAGQTAAMLAVKDSTGTLLSSIDASGSFTGTVSGSVSGNVTGTVGGATATNVAAATTLANAATASNTASTIVRRDSSKNFAANNITANQVTGLSAPTNGTDATHKTYVDDKVANSTSFLKACRLATTDTIDTIPSSLIVLDGVQTVEGDRILMKNFVGIGLHSTANGVYTATESGTWQRTSDLIVTGSIVRVQEGTTNGGTQWLISVDTDDGDIHINPTMIAGSGISIGYSNVGATISATVSGSSSNTANTLVQRDASGNFACGTITGALSGNATTATNVDFVPAQGKDHINSANYTAGSLVANPINFDPAGYVTITRGNSTGAIFPTPTFRGFPNLEVFPSGRLWVAYSSGSSHGAVGSVTMTLYSDDKGHTWSTDTLLAPVEGSPLSNSHLSSTGLLKSGTYKNRLFLTYWTDASTFTHVIYSDDFGATWSQGVNCYDSGAEFTTYVVSSTPFVAPDGSILVAGYGHTSGSSAYKCTALKSTDGGATWSRVSVIYDGSQGANANEQPEEPQMILLNDGQTILCSFREDGASSAVATKGTIRFKKSTDSGATWTDISSTYAAAPINGYGRPNICQTETGTVVCVTRAIPSILPDGDGVIHTSHDNGVTWTPYRKIDARNWFYSYGDVKRVGKNQLGFVYGIQNSAFSRSDVCFTYLIDGVGVSPFGGTIQEKVRASQLVSGSTNLDWVAPPSVATATDGTTLQTTLNSLINYLGSIGFGGHPLNCGSLTGLWEADTITNTVNDLNGTFSSNTHLTSTGGADITPTTSGGSFGVSSNKLVNSSPSGNNVVYWAVSAADGTFDADFTWNGSSQAWFLFRLSGATTYLMATMDATSTKLYKNVSGSLTLLSNPGLGGAFTSGVEQHIQVILAGASITVKVAGVTVISHTLSAGDQSTFLTPANIGWFMPTNTDKVDNVVFHNDLVTGSAISYVPDQSSHAYNLTQPTSNQQPTIYLAGSTPGLFNEKPFLKVYNLQNMYTSSFSLQSQPNAYVGVFFFDVANSGIENIMRCKFGSSYVQSLQVNTATYSKKLSLYAGTSGAAGTNPFSFTGVQTPGGPYLISALFNGASSLIRCNGKTVYRSTSWNHIATDGIDQFQLGDPDVGTAFLTPGVCVLAHGSPTIAEIMQCERYFANKYNIRLAVE